ncbi:uncharacterized protein LOC142348835 isoform X2 [Convolutriloba macropyga]|uniref:uncharacterized protein LOC142348835 isoform X2 n=1 Tax=Convolutriloba macropyga TaxID=536237 RepID=UPI003F521A5B
MGSSARAGSNNSIKSGSTSGNMSKRGSVIGKGSAAPSGTHLDVESFGDYRTDSNFSADSPEKGSTVLGIGSIFNIRRKKKRVPPNAAAQAEDPTSHEVTFTITVSQAVPTDESEKVNPALAATGGVDREATDSSLSKRKKPSEAPKPLQYFHYAYHLIPPEEGDEETQADVVTFPTAAKVYGKGALGSENPGVKTWREGDKTWFAFQHNHKIPVTKELLHKLFDHTLDLKVWNSKDKVSSTTRFDRPKGFRFPGPKPGEEPEDVGGVRATVFSQSKDFMSLQPKRYFQFRDDVYYSKRKDIYRMLPHEKVELEHKFAQWAETNPELIPKPPKDQKEKDWGGDEPKGLDESVYNLGGGSREDSAMAKIPHTIVGYQQANPLELEENLRTYSRLGRLAAASDRMDKPVGTAGGGRNMSIASSKGALGQQAAGTRRSSAASRVSRKSMSVAPGGGGGTGAGGRRQTGGGGGGIGATSMDRAMDEKEAQYNKYGLTSVSVRLSMLFAGLRSVTNRLDSGMDDVSDMFVTISVDEDLLNEQQRQALNPMSIKIESTSSMPYTPLNYSQLRKRCHPAYCRYKFGNLDWYKTPPKVQDRDIYWNDTNVVLLGMLDVAEVREMLRGALFQIEIHDRDGRKVKQEKPPALFGEEPDDEKISSIALVANKRTVHNAFESKSTWDPFGVANFDLCELLRGTRRLCLKSQIQQGPLPELLGLQSHNVDGGGAQPTGQQVVGNPNAVDGPVELPLPAGNYLECGSMMKLTVEVTHALATPSEVALNPLLPPSLKCPFSRMVLWCEQSDQQTAGLPKVLSKVREINCDGLQLNYLPQHSLPAALKTYRLSEEQKTSGECDVITGVHVLDGKFHLLLLEGLREGGISSLFHHVQDNLRGGKNTGLQVLFDSDLMFSTREYSSLGVSLFRVRMHEPLASILVQPLLYVRDMVPKLSFECLTKIAQMMKSGSLKDIVRNKLFPSVNMIKSMSKEFGIAYFQETNTNAVSPSKSKSKGDASTKYGQSSKHKSTIVPTSTTTHGAKTLEGKRSYKSSQRGKATSQNPEAGLDLDDTMESQSADIDGKHLYGSRPWTPLAMSNPEYEELLRQRAANVLPVRQYLDENKHHLAEVSNQNRVNNPKPRQFSAPLRTNEESGVHNYSSQTLNTTEISLDELRQVLQHRYPGRLFTFMQRDPFWNSGVIVPHNIKQTQLEAQLAEREKWLTKEGFVYPGMRSALGDNEAERPLDDQRAEEINSFVWRENTLHEGELKPALPFRDVFQWEYRKRDLDLRSKPVAHFGEVMPQSIMLAGDTKLGEERENYDRLMKAWRVKLGGRDPVLRFHRVNPQTEAIERGPKASNQQDRTKGLLKDKSKRVDGGVGIGEVPALGVVHYPSVDTYAREAGFSPPPGLAQWDGDGSFGGVATTSNKGPFTLGDDEEKHVGNNLVSLRPQRSARKPRGGDFSADGIDDSDDLPQFRLVNPVRHRLWNRTIDPLKEAEKENYLFGPIATIDTTGVEGCQTVERERQMPLLVAN